MLKPVFLYEPLEWPLLPVASLAPTQVLPDPTHVTSGRWVSLSLSGWWLLLVLNLKQPLYSRLELVACRLTETSCVCFRRSDSRCSQFSLTVTVSTFFQKGRIENLQGMGGGGLKWPFIARSFLTASSSHSQVFKHLILYLETGSETPAPYDSLPV
jgi:hypothetical protein